MASPTPSESDTLGQGESKCEPVDAVPNDEKLFEKNIHCMDSSQGVPYVETNEDFLIDFLQSKMNQGLYDLVIKVLKQVDCAANQKFLKFWDDAHYKKCQESKTRELTAVQKFRIRKRNKPPVGICPEGERPTLRMADDARAVLRKWFRQHEQHPYPSRRKKEQLAGLAGITITQVTTWFANARRKKKRRTDKSLNESKQATEEENNIRKIDSHKSSLPKDGCQAVPFAVNRPRDWSSLFGTPAIQSVPDQLCWRMSNLAQSTIPAHTANNMTCLGGRQDSQTNNELAGTFLRQPNYSLYYRPCMYSKINSPFESFCNRPLYNADQTLWIQPRTNALPISVKPESPVITRIRMKLHQNNLQKALETSYQHVSAVESLNSLRRLCDNIETTVVSPVDYAATVQLCECEYCTNDRAINLTNYRYESSVTDDEPTCPLSSHTTASLMQPPSTTRWQRTIYSDPCGMNPDPVGGSTEESFLCSVKQQVHLSARESRGLVNDCLIQCEPGQEEPSWWPQISCNDSGSQSLYKDGKQRDSQLTNSSGLEMENILQLQESYGTIIGEAVQGLLNLSSQESETSS